MNVLRDRLGFALLSFLPVSILLIETKVGWTHLAHEPWPAHAMFHVMIGVFCLQLVLIAVPLLLWTGVRRGRRWAWWAIAVCGTTVHGGHLLADAVSGGGLRNAATATLPGNVLYDLTLTYWVLYGVGLWLVRPRVASD